MSEDERKRWRQPNWCVTPLVYRNSHRMAKYKLALHRSEEANRLGNTREGRLPGRMPHINSDRRVALLATRLH